MSSRPRRQVRSTLLELVEVANDLTTSRRESVEIVRMLLRRARFVRSPGLGPVPTSKRRA
jgi:hypothetical protein